MRDGIITACHYQTRRPIQVTCDGGRIVALEPASGAAPPARWIAPSLVDVQVNGYAGVDFQQDNLTLADLQHAARALQADGCARWCFTIISDRWPRLISRLRQARLLRQSAPDLARSLIGWHVEGPFLSAQPGFAGAHNPEVMCDPHPDLIHELRAATGRDPVLLTLAPERRGAIECIALATSLGLKVSLGHTNAPAERLREAVDAGAIGFTHLGNGCPRELDRHDNILWRVFDTPGLVIGLITDRIHVSPALFRLAHRVLPAERIYYTTDAMAAAGAPPGRYRLAHLELEVGPDLIVRQPGSPLFAGSALRPLEGIRRAAEMLGKPWQELWPHFSTIPARLLGLSGELEPGGAADFCLLETAADGALRVVQAAEPGES